MNDDKHSDLQAALAGAKTSFLTAGGFSLVINFLMLVPTIYMLQLYDRVVPTGNQSTLVMLTLIVLFLFAEPSLPLQGSNVSRVPIGMVAGLVRLPS